MSRPNAAKQDHPSQTAIVCLLAIRDFISLFPDRTAELEPWVWNGIRFWEDILKWEKSPYFGGQMPPP